MAFPFLKHMSNTLFVGKVYHRFDELPSTNDWAAKLVALSDVSSPLNGLEGSAKTKPPEGTVVRAANQTAGRGQLGSKWHSAPEENLLLSIILYPTWLEAQAQFYLSMAVALSLRDVVVGLGMGGEDKIPSNAVPSTHIKWPNDIYIDNKKTAGILIQNAISGSSLQSAIVGIGLNVNQLEFPQELPNATSLALAFGQNREADLTTFKKLSNLAKLDLDKIADRLFECLERRYLQLKAGHRAEIKAEYEENLWRRGKTSRFVRSADGLEFEGIIVGVTERGLLQVKTGEGREEFEVKQIGFLV